VEVTNSLLVAMMFIMVLSIGIANILMALPPLVDRRVDLVIDRVQLSWLILVLLLHLDLFWQVLFILEREEWEFAGFLYIITGPVVLLFAASILIPDPSRASGDSNADYFAITQPVFTLLALVLAWLVGVDLIFGSGVEPATVWDLVAAGLCAALALSRSRRVHLFGAGLAWLLFLSVLTARGVGLLA